MISGAWVRGIGEGHIAKRCRVARRGVGDGVGGAGVSDDVVAGEARAGSRTNGDRGGI